MIKNTLKTQGYIRFITIYSFFYKVNIVKVNRRYFILTFNSRKTLLPSDLS